MIKLFWIVVAFALQNTIFAQKETVYLIHGQGADERLFKNINLDTTLFQTCPLLIPIPQKKETMQHLAQRMIPQIDTTHSFSIIGVSLGGMVSSELIELLNPRKVIIISSAGWQEELPKRYRIMRNFPLYKIFPPMFFKVGSFIAQPIVEPDRRKERKVCNAMLCRKNPIFLKRATQLIITWEKERKHPEIIHIHGDNDHTVPIKNVKYNYLISKGSHMMTLTRADEINQILNKELKF